MEEFKIKPQNIYNRDEKGFLIGIIKKSMHVLIEASEKAAFLRQPGDREIEAKLRLENKRKEKAFRDTMIASTWWSL